MKKRILSCLLSMAVLLTWFMVGCATNNAEGTATAPASEAAAQAAAEPEAESEPETTEPSPSAETAPAAQPVQDVQPQAEEEPPAAETAPLDQEEQALKTLYGIVGTDKESIYEAVENRPSLTLPLCEQTTTLSYWGGSPNLDYVISTWEDHEGYQYLETLTNVEIQWVENPPPTMQEKFNLMVAGGDYTDILTDVMNYSVTGSADWFIEEEIGIDLTDLVAECCPSYWGIVKSDPEYALFAWSEEGRVCGLVGSYCMYDYVKSGPTYRADFLNQLGMEIPLTIDELHSYLTGCKEQGLCDSPMYMTYWGGLSGDAVLTAYGIRGNLQTRANFSPFYLDENDQAHFGPTSDEFRAYLTMLHQWYEEGLIGDLYNSDICDAGDIVNSAYAVYFSNANGEPEEIAHSSGDTEFALCGGYYPRMTQDQILDCGYTTEYNLYFLVSTDCEEYKLALNWLDYRFSPHGSELMQYGVPGVTDEYDEEGKPYYTDFYLNNPNYTQAQMNEMYVNPGYGWVTDRRIEWLAGDEALYQKVSAWAYNVKASDSSLLGYCAMNSEESTVYANAFSDMQTYGSECIAKFIVGAMDIDSDWAAYVSSMEGFGTAQCEQIVTQAFSRYINKDIPD